MGLLAAMESITVCIAAYKRQRLLEILLERLSRQNAGGAFTFSIIVVDNDQELSSRPVVMSVAEKSAVPISYYSQPIKNIALARNMCIEKSSGDYIAFIDDDEYPVQDWLLSMYRTLQEFKVNGVQGAVRPDFDGKVGTFFRKHNFFSTPVWNTGASRYYPQHTANCLIKAHVFRDCGFCFDPDFGLSGGEDVIFFHLAQKAGYSFCWCEEAMVYEYIPPQRANLLWIIKRKYHYGNIVAAVGNEGKSFFQKIKLFIFSTLLLLFYVIFCPLILCCGRKWYEYLLNLVFIAGKSGGMLNLKFYKY